MESQMGDRDAALMYRILNKICNFDLDGRQNF